MLSTFDAALAAHEFGHSVIPCHEGTKVPAVRWSRWRTEQPPVDLLASWFKDTRQNMSLVVKNMIIFDVDDGDPELVLNECGDTPHKIKTPNGIHLGYRKRAGVVLGNQINIKGKAIDLKTDGGLTMLPPSVVGGKQYAWLGSLQKVSALPLAKIGWTRERKKAPPKKTMDTITDRSDERILNYIARIEPAVSGNKGHNKMLYAATKIAFLTGFDWPRAWKFLLMYNARCVPPWDVTDRQEERALEHKLREAFKQARP